MCFSNRQPYVHVRFHDREVAENCALLVAVELPLLAGLLHSEKWQEIFAKNCALLVAVELPLLAG